MQTTKQTKLIKESFRELMKGVCTSIPGHVLAFDPVTQWAQVQIGVERVDVNGAVFTPPPIINVPVSFTGDDWVLEHQINPGCEGEIRFSQRCIDGWQQTGGVAVNPLGRFHDMQDAVFVPGIRSLPNVVTDFANDGMRLRDKAGTQFLWLKGDGSVLMENTAGHIRLGADGTVTINGVTIDTAGNVNSPTQITANGIGMTTHRHGGVQPGAGTSGGPVA